MPEEKLHQIGIKVPSDMLAWLKACARAEDRPLAYLVKRILAEKMAADERATKPRAAKR
jgi:hypothetical protein